MRMKILSKLDFHLDLKNRRINILKATVTSITGFYEAFVSMFMSKRTWTPELDAEIKYVCNSVLDNNGSISVCDDDVINSENYKKFEKWLSMLLRMGKRHITVLRYLDITIMTEGLHRAGQDDVDAHARRFDIRIIRNSTRLATFDDGEMSDYYKDKVLTDGQACKILGFELPNEIDHNGKTYVKSTNGYVLKEYENNKDVKRGLYMLGIPSNFISKINLCEWGHVFKERCDGGGANPEVKEWAEQVMKQITEFHKEITRDYVLSIQN